MIVSGDLEYDVDGATMVGYLARPRGEEPWPAVLIAHDGVGLETYQRTRADQLAARGAVAFALDYHGGRTFFGEPQAMLDRVLPLLADRDRMRVIGTAALDVLLSQSGADPERIAIIGYGAGGSIALELARAGVPFRGLAAVHPGVAESEPADWADVTASVLLCTGSEDPICPPDRLLGFARTLQEAGVDWRAVVYGGAEHAFWAAPTDADGRPVSGTTHAAATVPGVSHHPTQTPRAWRAVLDLLEESVGLESAGAD